MIENIWVVKGNSSIFLVQIQLHWNQRSYCSQVIQILWKYMLFLEGIKFLQAFEFNNKVIIIAQK